MTPLCLQENDVTYGHLRVLGMVADEMEPYPDDLTCHQVCELLVTEWPERFLWYRGKFAGLDHSWLVFRDCTSVILDPYPWAAASGPLLVTTVGLSPWAKLYVGEPVKASDAP